MANFGTYEGHRIHSDAAGKMVDSASRGFQILANAMENEKQRKMDAEQFDRKQSEIERAAKAGEELQKKSIEETIRSNKAGEEDVDNKLTFDYKKLNMGDDQFYAQLDQTDEHFNKELEQKWDIFIKQDENADLDRESLNNRFFSQLKQDDEQFYKTHQLKIDQFEETRRQYDEMDKDRDINTASNVAMKGAQTNKIIKDTKTVELDNEYKEMKLKKEAKAEAKSSAVDEFISDHGNLRSNALYELKNTDIDWAGDKLKAKEGEETSLNQIFGSVSKMTAHQSRADLRRSLKKKYPDVNFSNADIDGMLEDQRADNSETLNLLKQKFNNQPQGQVAAYLESNPEEADALRDWIGSTDNNWDKSFDLAAFLTGGDPESYGAGDLEATSKGWANNKDNSDKNFSTAGKTEYGSDVKFKSNQDSTPKNRQRKNLLVNALGNQNAGKTWIEQTGPDTWSLEVYDFWGNDDWHVKFIKDENGMETPHVKLMGSDDSYVPIDTIEID